MKYEAGVIYRIKKLTGMHIGKKYCPTFEGKTMTYNPKTNTFFFMECERGAVENTEWFRKVGSKWGYNNGTVGWDLNGPNGDGGLEVEIVSMQPYKFT